MIQSSRQEHGRGIRAFENRLHWHCHFIQKLETQPSIEFDDFHPLMRELRSSDDDRLAAWAEGRTGVPFVDACMRALQSHGWINFRMRAMLMSFASYHLWLPWRERPPSGSTVRRLRARDPLESVSDAIRQHSH